ncbi:MAG: TonB family protein [bacterium]
MLGMSRRETNCFLIAMGIHSLLFLWKASEFKIPNMEMNPIIDINYLEKDPSIGLAQRRGSPAQKKRTFIGKIKNILGLGQKRLPKQASPEEDKLLGTTKIEKIDTKRLQQKTASEPRLKDKSETFKDTSIDVNKISKKQQSLVDSKGPNISTSRSLPAVNAQEKLEDKSYKIAKKHVPFEVATAEKSGHTLASDKIYIPTASNTSKSVKDLSSRVNGSGLQGVDEEGSLSDKGDLSGLSGTGTLETRLSKVSHGGGDLAGAGGQGSGREGYGYKDTGYSSPAGGIGDLSRGSGSGQTISTGSSGSNDSGSDKRVLFELTGQLAGRTILRKKIPPIPDWAQKEGIQATVSLYIEVLSDGKVKNTVVVQKTSGYPKLDKLVSDVMLEWLFAPLPAKDYGKVQWGVITFRFDIR